MNVLSSCLAEESRNIFCWIKDFKMKTSLKIQNYFHKDLMKESSNCSYSAVNVLVNIKHFVPHFSIILLCKEHTVQITLGVPICSLVLCKSVLPALKGQWYSITRMWVGSWCFGKDPYTNWKIINLLGFEFCSAIWLIFNILWLFYVLIKLQEIMCFSKLVFITIC